MHSQAYRAALGACLAACAGSCLAGEECSMHHMRIPTDELIALMLMVLGLTINPGRSRVPVRCGSIPRLTYRLLQGKKTYTRGPAWASRSPLTPGDALDIGRGDARYLLRPLPPAASHHSAGLPPHWLRPRWHAKEQHLAQGPPPIGQPSGHRWRARPPHLGRSRPLGGQRLGERLTQTDMGQHKGVIHLAERQLLT